MKKSKIKSFKGFISFLLAAVLFILPFFSVTSGAYNNLPVVTSGTIGNTRWSYTATSDDSGFILFTCNGAMNGTMRLDGWLVGIIENKNVELRFSDGVTAIPASFVVDFHLNKNHIKNIVFGKNIQTIGECAFQNCQEIVSLSFPASLTTIQKNAFAECLCLKSLNLADTKLSFIGEGAFYRCSSLESVVLPKNLKTINKSAFQYCKKLKKVSFPGSLTSIGEKAFSDCESLSSVPFSSLVNLQSIGPRAFQGCTSLSGTLRFCSSVKEINESAFEGCSGIKQVFIPLSLRVIESAAFKGCSALTGLFIPRSVKQIKSDAFSGCSKIAKTIYGGSENDIAGTDIASGNETMIKSKEIGYGYEEIAKFTDVDLFTWYSDAVKFGIDNRLFKGTSVTTFEPNTAMNRAMLVQVLYNYEGSPEVRFNNTFSDVKEKDWFAKAVIWAAENGIVAGTGGGKYSPNLNLSREQIALILKNYLQLKNKQTDNRNLLTEFPDAGKTSAWAKDAVSWAVAIELISGNGNKELDPRGDATRAMVAKILQKLIIQLPNIPDIPSDPDNPDKPNNPDKPSDEYELPLIPVPNH